MNSLALLPNLMGPDGLIIFLFILLFFGAKRLPELAKGLGSAVREFSKAKDEIEHEITRAPEHRPQIEPPRESTQPHLQAASSTVAHGAHDAPIVGGTASVPITPSSVSPETAAHGVPDDRSRTNPAGDPIV